MLSDIVDELSRSIEFDSDFIPSKHRPRYVDLGHADRGFVSLSKLY